MKLSFCLCCISLLIRNADAQIKSAFGKQSNIARSTVTTSPQWIQKSLETHNFFRSLHGSPPLVLNNTLSEISQAYANELLSRNLRILDQNGNGEVYFEHNPGIKSAYIGENLYYSSYPSKYVGPIPGHFAVLLWYEEIKDYDFASAKHKVKVSNPEKKPVGHLTQVLWKDTTQMGTAVASAKLGNNELTFVVANYYRPGNVQPKEKFYFKNVLPPEISEADVNAVIISKNIQGWWTEREIKSETPDSFRKAALNAHNFYRKYHFSQQLRINYDICKVSQNWADHLLEKGLQLFNANGVVYPVDNNYLGSVGCRLGESSLFFVSGEDEISPELPVRIWYKEREFYNFDKPKSNKDVGQSKTDRFQQIVWNATTEFCMSYATGKADNGQYLTYVVANYYPAIESLSVDKKWNVFPSEIDPLTGKSFKGCCSVGIIFLILICCLIAIFLFFIGFVYKFKRDWYESARLRFKK